MNCNNELVHHLRQRAARYDSVTGKWLVLLLKSGTNWGHFATVIFRKIRALSNKKLGKFYEKKNTRFMNNPPENRATVQSAASTIRSILRNIQANLLIKNHQFMKIPIFKKVHLSLQRLVLLQNIFF